LPNQSINEKQKVLPLKIRDKINNIGKKQKSNSILDVKLGCKIAV
jgi:hypothetical protein